MTNTRKILIVDDDFELREALVEQLALHEEFESIAVDNGTKGVQTAKAGQIDLVIMDVGLPDVDGREAVRILRKKGFKAPIIMLTGHNTCQSGISCDFGGVGYQQLSDDDKKVILSAYPRLNMKKMLTTCLCDIAKNHPNTTRDNFIADFGLKYVPGYTRMSSVDFLHQAPFVE